MAGEARDSFDWLSGVLAHGAPIGPGTDLDDDEPGQNTGPRPEETWRDTWRRFKFLPGPEPTATARPAFQRAAFERDTFEGAGDSNGKTRSSRLKYKPAFLTNHAQEPAGVVPPALEQIDHERFEDTQIDHEQFDYEQFDYEQFDYEQFDYEQFDYEQLEDTQLQAGSGGPTFEPGTMHSPKDLSPQTPSPETVLPISTDHVEHDNAPAAFAPAAAPIPLDTPTPVQTRLPAEASAQVPVQSPAEDTNGFDFEADGIPGSRRPRTEPFAPNQPRLSVSRAILRKLRRR